MKRNKMGISFTSLVNEALIEDIGNADITSLAIFSQKSQKATAHIIAKQNGIISGIHFITEVYRILSSDVKVDLFFQDGSRVTESQKIARIEGISQILLSGERVALNFLQHFSGIATYTHSLVEKIHHTRAKILDTRKTTPLLRKYEKEAVRHGGGYNHRMGLYDMILIKENHIAACGSMTKAIDKAKKFSHIYKIEVETQNLADVKEAAKAGADIIMFDNFSVEQVVEAQNFISAHYSHIYTEASGRINDSNITMYAETGVSFISVGSIIHSAPAFDFSMIVETV